MQNNQRPEIPAGVAAANIFAVARIHHQRAADVNRSITGHTLVQVTDPSQDAQTPNSVVGAYVFMSRTHDETKFTFGRGHKGVALDVYLPGPGVGQWHFSLLPDWSTNHWRLQSQSEIVATINDAPLQKHTARTKKNKMGFPQTVLLKQDSDNHIVVNGLKIDLWFYRTVQTIFSADECANQAIENNIGEFSQRPEPWAQKRFLLTQKQVSNKSFRAIERFTGKTYTAKLFQMTEQNNQGDIDARDHEFQLFNMQMTNPGIVRYLETTNINGIPAIITDSHYGYASYATLRETIHQFHPGARCAIAAKLIYRLFSALAFLHFHGTIHGHVNNDSVLLRLDGDKPVDALLVNYTTSQPILPDAAVPMGELLDDAQSAMAVIEDCSNLWALRNGPAEEAMSEAHTAHMIEHANSEYDAVSAAATDYFGRQNQSKDSEKGKKLLKLLSDKYANLRLVQNNQAHNATLLQVTNMTKRKIDALLEDWQSGRSSAKLGDDPWMIVSLGHPWLDSLVDDLYQKKGKDWTFKPAEISGKIEALGGRLEEPWQYFEVAKTTLVKGDHLSFNEDSLLAWIATYCEVYPKWRDTLQAESSRHLQPRQPGLIDRKALGDFAAALPDSLPSPMASTLRILMNPEALLSQNEADSEPHYQLNEVHRVWYHIPSRMFNLTQVQRLADIDRLVTVIEQDSFRCDNFVEVRGDPQIQGHYVSLAILTNLVDQLGLNLPQRPVLTANMPTFDPADFSQAKPGVIVLARPGFIGYATVERTGYQIQLLEPKHTGTKADFETAGSFLPTQFGDMKVLPELPVGMTHQRAAHWSQYKTAHEIEAAGDLSKRKILYASGKVSTLVPTLPKHLRPQENMAADMGMDIDEPPLIKVLHQRAYRRAAIQPVIKRKSSEAPNSISTVPQKRIRLETQELAPQHQLPDISLSFVQRAAALAEDKAATAARQAVNRAEIQTQNSVELTHSMLEQNNALLGVPVIERDPDHSFTVVDETESLAEQWKDVEIMMSGMDKEDVQVGGLTAFQYHGEDSSMEDENSPPRSVDRDDQLNAAEPSRVQVHQLLELRPPGHSENEQPTTRGIREGMFSQFIVPEDDDMPDTE